MTERLNIIFESLPSCNVFADIGCDHGYIASAMINAKKCRKVIVSDISEKCLQKARELLAEFIQDGLAESVVSDGFDNVGECDLALIAGMGGELICSIIERAKVLPEKLVLQPMKNADKVRKTAVKKGYRIISDRLFISAGKYYDLISLEKGTDSLSLEEIEFGRDNVKGNNPHFKKVVEEKIQKINGYLSDVRLSDGARKEMLVQLEKLSKYV